MNNQLLFLSTPIRMIIIRFKWTATLVKLICQDTFNRFNFQDSNK